MPAPERWWPAGYGEPALYDLAIVLEHNDTPADTLAAHIGLREFVREPDAGGESFFFRVNGVPVFAKGANWIPADSFPARVMAARYREHLVPARDCGMNMLRIWGGGLYETEAFYILPGVAREVYVRSWSPMAAASAAARLRWRAL